MNKKLTKPILAALFCVLSVMLFTGCAVNPITGQDELMLFGQGHDVEIGKTYAPQIEKEMGGRIADEQLQNYIDHVGQTVARVSHSPGIKYSFVALEDETVNAFALHGGYLFITRGMLEKLQTEAQLAGILAHEIVHVVARDTSAAMSREIGIGILLTTATPSDAGQGVLLARDIARQIIGLGYSRQDERTADLGGMDYMVHAGYDPYGMVESMQMLEELNEFRPIEFFSTHPNPENRVDYLTARIQAYYTNLSAAKVGREDYQRLVLVKLKK